MKTIYKLATILGLILIIVPSLLGYSFDLTVFWTGLAVGTALIVMPVIKV